MDALCNFDTAIAEFIFEDKALPLSSIAENNKQCN